jgi:CheY-like chemotaxis protein
MTDGSTTHILVVDDDQPTREVLRMILEDAAYPVLEASAAEAALDLLRNATERMVALFDHLMPAMDGLQALHLVSNDAGLAARHAYILITADMRPLSQDDISMLASLRCPIVRKPFDLDTLLSVVAQQVALLHEA